MKDHKLINGQSIAEKGQSSPQLRQRQRAILAFLAMTALVILAGCVSDGYHGGSYGYRGPYHSGGYYGGGFHGGYGIQHGFGRSGFGHGGGFGGRGRH